MHRRVLRLLDENVVRESPPRAQPLRLAIVSAAALGAVVAGSMYGEQVVRTIVGVW